MKDLPRLSRDLILLIDKNEGPLRVDPKMTYGEIQFKAGRRSLIDQMKQWLETLKENHNVLES